MLCQMLISYIFDFMHFHDIKLYETLKYAFYPTGNSWTPPNVSLYSYYLAI